MCHQCPIYLPCDGSWNNTSLSRRRNRLGLGGKVSSIPRYSGIVSGSSWRTTINNFNAQRKNAARKLGNPRLLRIHFHTLRHWKATMEYHRTKDILYVMHLLGYRNINNTLIYTQLIEDEDSSMYCSAVARNIEEAQKLIEAGFEYVCNHNGTMLFRKRK